MRSKVKTTHLISTGTPGEIQIAGLCHAVEGFIASGMHIDAATALVRSTSNCCHHWILDDTLFTGHSPGTRLKRSNTVSTCNKRQRN